MLEQPDTLLTIAEIAVAFAGFAGIASVLGRRHPSIDPRVNALRLHNMVDVGLGVIFMAFAPVLLDAVMPHITSDERWFWPLTSGIALLWGVALFLRMSNRARPVEQLIGYDLPGQLRVKVLGVLAMGSAACNIAFPDHALSYAVYLSAVLICLTVCGILFMRILNSLLVIELSEDEGASRGHR
jgi:hypothetical protein